MDPFFMINKGWAESKLRSLSPAFAAFLLSFGGIVKMKTVFSLFIFIALVSTAYALPSFQEVKDSYRKSDSVLLDRHGKVIHELRTDPTGQEA